MPVTGRRYLETSSLITARSAVDRLLQLKRLCAEGCVQQSYRRMVATAASVTAIRYQYIDCAMRPRIGVRPSSYMTRSSAVAVIADRTACKFAVRTPLRVHCSRHSAVSAHVSAGAANSTVPTGGRTNAVTCVLGLWCASFFCVAFCG